MELNFNQCLTLLIIGFIFALIICRCLLAVVNRGFYLVDYAKEQIYGKKGGKTGKFNLIQEGIEIIKPIAQQKVMEWIGGGKHG